MSRDVRVEYQSSHTLDDTYRQTFSTRCSLVSQCQSALFPKNKCSQAVSFEDFLSMTSEDDASDENVPPTKHDEIRNFFRVLESTSTNSADGEKNPTWFPLFAELLNYVWHFSSSQNVWVKTSTCGETDLVHSWMKWIETDSTIKRVWLSTVGIESAFIDTEAMSKEEKK